MMSKILLPSVAFWPTGPLEIFICVMSLPLTMMLSGIFFFFMPVPSSVQPLLAEQVCNLVGA